MDLAAVAAEIEALHPPPSRPARRATHAPGAATDLPRREFRHEPERPPALWHPDAAPWRRRGREVDYERACSRRAHVRGKGPAPARELVRRCGAAHIDKGLPTTGSLAQVGWPSTWITCRCTAGSHLRARRTRDRTARRCAVGWRMWCAIAAAGGCKGRRDAEPRCVHARETPVAILKPANLRDGKTHGHHLWSY